jgi:DNA primase
MSISEWVNSAYLPDISDDIGPVIDYVINRGFDPMTKNFYWSPAPGYVDRVIIPFVYDGKIVGSTARKVRDGKPKYLSDQHPFFVFNVDEQSDEHQYLFVVEGPFDAISIGGVALLTNEISDQQARIINSIGKQVIVIPDQDKAGTFLIDQAKELGWSIAFPTWEDSVKDCAEAVKKYGKLFVVVDAVKSATANPAKIEIEKRKMLNNIAMEN